MTEEAKNSSHLRPPGIETEIVPVTEMTIDELYSKTEDINPETGERMTRLDVLRREEEEQHGGRVFTQIGDRLSEGAKRANTLLSGRGVRAGGAFVMAVLAVRQVKRHFDHKSD